VHHGWWWDRFFRGNELVDLEIDFGLGRSLSVVLLSTLSGDPVCVLLVLGGCVQPCWVNFSIFLFLFFVRIVSFSAPTWCGAALSIKFAFVLWAWCCLLDSFGLWLGLSDQLLFLERSHHCGALLFHTFVEAVAIGDMGDKQAV